MAEFSFPHYVLRRWAPPQHLGNQVFRVGNRGKTLACEAEQDIIRRRWEKRHHWGLGTDGERGLDQKLQVTDEHRPGGQCVLWN